MLKLVIRKHGIYHVQTRVWHVQIRYFTCFGRVHPDWILEFEEFENGIEYSLTLLEEYQIFTLFF